MKKPKILVVGSFVMDQIAITEIIPNEGQTVLGKSFHRAPGGKGANQAVQMARLGADVTVVGKLGCDSNGQEMRAVCEKAGIDTSHILYDEETASGCSVILLEERPGMSVKNRILVIPGANMAITTQDVAFLEEGIAAYDLVVLQLEIPIEVNLRVAQYARKKNIPVMLNAAPSAPLPEELLACLTYLSPNEHEAEDLTGIAIPHAGTEVDAKAVRVAAKILLEKGVESVLITLGSAGAALVTKENLMFSPAVQGVQVVDPTAAGDSFIGAFCVAISFGFDTKSALRFANHTAAITVTQLGAMPSLPKLEDVLAAYPEFRECFQ